MDILTYMESIRYDFKVKTTKKVAESNITVGMQLLDKPLPLTLTTNEQW